MSRVRKASLVALFTYARFGLSLVGGILLVPFILEHLGARTYGLWLASGEILAYAGMADLGVLGTLQWLIAQADGQGNRAAVRRLMLHGAVAGLALGLLYGALVAVLWFVLPGVLRLTELDRSQILAPLALIAIASAVALMLRVFPVALAGLQDVRFNGMLGIVQWSLHIVLTVWLLLNGHGLYALAVAAAIPALVTVLASLVRLKMIAPDLLADWTRPSRPEVLALFREGLGPWLSGWGWRLGAASDGIIVAALGRPAAVASLACTLKLGQVLMQMSWVPCDSGLVGLAQLSGEGRPERVRAACMALLRIGVGLAGAVACLVLALNAAFVWRWVGPDLFAGRTVNTLVAVSIVVVSFGHAVGCAASVLGNRLRVGVAVLVSGVVHVGLAFALGARWGLPGVVAATIVSQGPVFLTIAVPLLRSAARLGWPSILAEVVLPWLGRFTPIVAASVVLGLVIGTPPLWVTLPLGAFVGGLYLWRTRQLYLEFPPVMELWQRFAGGACRSLGRGRPWPDRSAAPRPEIE